MGQRRAELTTELARIVPTAAPFIWEVGCGHGHFLTAYAQAHPELICIGIDIMSDRIRRAERKRDRAKLPNLFFLHAEARLFLETLPSSARLGKIIILFPDPWPKARHHKHRILQPVFLDAAVAHAASDCRLLFRTDFRPYFDEAAAAVSAHPRWELTDDAWPFEFETVFQSRAPVFHSLIARPVIHRVAAQTTSVIS